MHVIFSAQKGMTSRQNLQSAFFIDDSAAYNMDNSVYFSDIAPKRYIMWTQGNFTSNFFTTHPLTPFSTLMH